MTSMPSPTSTMHTSLPPSRLSVATTLSLQTCLSRRNVLKSTLLSLPPLPPSSLKTRVFCSSVKQASSLPVSSCSLSKKAPNSSPFALFPLAISPQISSEFRLAFLAWACTAARTVCRSKAPNKGVLFSESRGAATLLADSMSFCSCSRLAWESCTNFWATKRCSRSVHCLESFASSTWQSVSRDCSLERSAVTGPRNDSAKVLES
mmetsp:Transcript_2583/g.5864  ORF Transcript_2583/g.5864 Transcript_2583/m.5864 type:complete len:206 (+) Transcript_2583:141-758(+)